MNKEIEVKRIDLEGGGNCHVCGRGAESNVKVSVEVKLCGMEFHFCHTCVITLSKKSLDALAEDLK